MTNKITVIHPITIEDSNFWPTLKVYQFFNIIIEEKCGLHEISYEKSEKVKNFISSLYIHYIYELIHSFNESHNIRVFSLSHFRISSTIHSFNSSRNCFCFVEKDRGLDDSKYFYLENGVKTQFSLKLTLF
jgi:hypothetical protein